MSAFATVASGGDALVFGGRAAVAEPGLLPGREVLARLAERDDRGLEVGLRLHDLRAVLRRQRRVRFDGALRARGGGVVGGLRRRERRLDLRVDDGRDDLARPDALAGPDRYRSDVPADERREHLRARLLNDSGLGERRRERAAA